MDNFEMQAVNSLYISAMRAPILRSFLRLYLEIFGVPLLGKRIRHHYAMQMASPEINGKDILDVGCTIGDFSLLLASNGARVLGVDLADRMQPASKLAKSHGLSASYIVHDILTLGFNDHFDGIFALDLLEHIEDDIALASKFHAMLKPGGFIVISVPSPFRKINYAFEESIGHVRKGYSIDTLRDLLAGVSLEVEDSFYVDTFDLMGKFYAVRGNFIKPFLFPFFYPFAKRKVLNGKTGSLLMCKVRKQPAG